ncbi:hypothetical protein RB653_005072 [Dictyostelium firmibasis]|uniref:Cytochrome P450 n=1 Tax=Dictyostelium firmibasis TaxID=79012 RepID=A0AAN7YYX5_9MYCE
MGDYPTVVITDPDHVNEIWCKQFQNFVNRPHFKSLDQFSSGFKNLSFSDYPLWSELRKLVAVSFTKSKVKGFSNLLETQTNYLIKTMNNYSIDNKPFNPKKYIHKLTLNIVCMIAFSKEINNDEDINEGDMARLTKPKEMIFKHLGSSNLGDFIELLRPLYYFKNKKFGDRLMEIQSYIKEIYDDHLLNLDLNNSPKDIMDQLIISTDGKEDIIIQTCIDFLIAGSDTVGVTIEWFLVYLSNNPTIQETCFKELFNAFNNNNNNNTNRNHDEDEKIIGFGDEWSNKTPFLNACIKEVMRIKPVTSLSLPRIAIDDAFVNGYRIPKGTQVIQNIYGLSNSDHFLNDPLTFNPYRWLEYEKLKSFQKDLQKQQLEQQTKLDCGENYKHKYFNDLDKISIPFSTGRRGCVGVQLGEAELYIVCANIIYNFKIGSWDGKIINEMEDFGITIHPSAHNLKISKRK